MELCVIGGENLPLPRENLAQAPSQLGERIAEGFGMWWGTAKSQASSGCAWEWD